VKPVLFYCLLPLSMLAKDELSFIEKKQYEILIQFS